MLFLHFSSFFLKWSIFLKSNYNNVNFEYFLYIILCQTLIDIFCFFLFLIYLSFDFILLILYLPIFCLSFLVKFFSLLKLLSYLFTFLFYFLLFKNSIFFFFVILLLSLCCFRIVLVFTSAKFCSSILEFFKFTYQITNN